MNKKLLPKNLLRKNFDTKIVVAKINPQKFLWIYFCKILFCIKIFCIRIVCVANVCIFIFDSKETTHAEINVQNFVTEKMLMQSFLLQKNVCKNKSSKTFDYLVRANIDKGLEFCGREGTGE